MDEIHGGEEMTRNYYSVYKDGKLIANDIPCSEVSKITGIYSGEVHNFSHSPSSFNGYRVKLVRQVKTEPKKKYVVNTEKQIPTWWNSDLENRWNDMLVAAYLFKRGLKAVRA
jgi:hypothetical protein